MSIYSARETPNPSLERDLHRHDTWPARRSGLSSASQAKRHPGSGPSAQTLGLPVPMNPVLKSLTQPGISLSLIADQLEKHIGRSPSEYHCRQAFEAIELVKNARVREYAALLRKIVNADGADDQNYCYVLRFVITALRTNGLLDEDSTHDVGGPES